MNKGIAGASIAICITNTLNFLSLFIYTVCHKKFRSMWRFDRYALQDWSSYLKIGIPGTLMIMLDMWCYEIINLESGFLRIEATAAAIILNNFQVMLVQVANGISMSASTLVGGAIGENDIYKA